MESHDPLVMMDVKIEIDVAEDPFGMVTENEARSRPPCQAYRRHSDSAATGEDSDNTTAVVRHSPDQQPQVKLEPDVKVEPGVQPEPGIGCCVDSEMDSDAGHDYKPQVTLEPDVKVEPGVHLEVWTSHSCSASERDSDTKHDYKPQVKLETDVKVEPCVQIEPEPTHSYADGEMDSDTECDTGTCHQTKSGSQQSEDNGQLEPWASPEGGETEAPGRKSQRWAYDLDKDYLCAECGLLLSGASSLKLHMLSHSGQTPHQCDSNFSQADDLRKHMPEPDVKVEPGVQLEPRTSHCCAENEMDSDTRHENEPQVKLEPDVKVQSGVQLEPGISHCSADIEGDSDAKCETEAGHQLKSGSQQSEDTGQLEPWTRPEGGETQTPNRQSQSWACTFLFAYQCVECGLMFRCASSFKKHMLSHNGERALQCSVRVSSFIRADDLNKNKTGKKTCCTKCDKKFSSDRNLTHRLFTCSEQKRHFCAQCGKKFSNSGNLEKHMLSHTGHKPHQCTQCDKKFSQPGKLKQHMLTHTGEKPHQCPQCGKKFSQIGSLKSHMLTHTGLRPYHCTHCDKKFFSAKSLKTHMLTHTGLRPYHCTHCDKKFSSASGLKSHTVKHTGQYQHLCAQCGKKFSNTGNLKTHMLSHTGQKPHQCTLCDKKFSQTGNLKTHILTHTREKPHQCPWCGKKFSASGSLKKHVLTHSRQTPPQCRVPDSNFSQADDLSKSMLHSTGQKPPHSTHFDRKFSSVSSLKIHTLVHTRQKPYMCAQCGKKYSHARTLKTHMETHTGQKPHQCTQCHKCFALTRSFKAHMLTHTEQKPHMCAQCGKKFSLSGNLKKHMLTHTGDKPYQCTLCDKKFSQFGNLKTHMSIHTGEKPHQCPHCSKKYSQPGGLKKHILTHTTQTPHQCRVPDSNLGQADDLRKSMPHSIGQEPLQCTHFDEKFSMPAWATATKSNSGHLDRVQNQAQGLVTGASGSTPIPKMEEVTRLQSLEDQKNIKILTQASKFKRPENHPVLNRMSRPTKCRLKRGGFIHQSRQLERTMPVLLEHEAETIPTDITHPSWRGQQSPSVITSIPGVERTVTQSDSDLQRKTLALEYICNHYPQEDWTHVFTDDCATEVARDGGASILIQYKDGDEELALPAGKYSANYCAEQEALCRAATAVSQNPTRTTGQVVLFSDALSVLQVLQNSNNKELNPLTAALATLSAEVQRVVLQWVPARCGINPLSPTAPSTQMRGGYCGAKSIKGNEKADSLAKEGAQKEQTDNLVSCDEAETITKAHQKKEWQLQHPNYNSNDGYHLLQGWEQVWIFRLRTGHNRLNHHMHEKFSTGQTAECPCGEGQMTAEHILQDCPTYAALRTRTWPTPTAVENKLYGTLEKLRRTVKFIEDTGLKL